MSSLRYLFLFVAMSIGLVESWDLAITVGDQLEFYSNHTKTGSEGAQFKDLTALAYDAVYNMLLFVDKQSDNASIFCYHLSTKKYQSLVRRKSEENIQGIAFDPITKLLFWTERQEKIIFYMSLKPGSKNDVYGNVFIRMDDEIPRGIAVDSCRGYVYWTNINNKPTIERARLDGTERTVIIDHTSVSNPVSIAIDQQTKRLYWIDDYEGIGYTIESSDLDGKNRVTLLKGTDHNPNTITVSNDTIFWIDWGFNIISSIPKTPSNYITPKDYINFKGSKPFGIVANYKIEDQLKDSSECEALVNLTKNKEPIDDMFSVPPDEGLFCVHGSKVIGKQECKCKLGYTGDRCDISVCKNYCYQGRCTLTSEGEPMCSCKEGFIGNRCETDTCYNYCINGDCKINEKHQPVCSCHIDFEGSRCENVKPISTSTSRPTTTVISTTKETVSVPETEVVCNCTTEQNSSKISTTYASNDDFVETSLCTEDWDTLMHPATMVLGILCLLLFVACIVFITKIMQLKKRPRIKKRIIVNKNVTPLTARPDQCEITIENCCNMNICETPCFEPRSTIRPTLLNIKKGKEENKNLIANMECPDDY